MPTVQELLSQNISNAQTNVKTWGPLMYNALEHGVKGDWDGVKGTDDTEAMQKLVNKAIAEGRKCIGLPHTPTGGMYYVTHLDDADQVVFVGDNASFVGGFTGTINQLGTFGVPQEEFDELKADVIQRGINVMHPPSPLDPAAGDGVEDDTIALQAIFDSDPGVVYFPKGTYIVDIGHQPAPITDGTDDSTCAIALNHPVKIIMHPEAVIRAKYGSGTATCGFMFSVMSEGVSFEYPTFYGDRDNVNGVRAIQINAGHCSIYNMSVKSLDSSPIVINGTAADPVNHIHIAFLQAEDVGNTIFAVHSSYNEIHHVIGKDVSEGIDFDKNVTDTNISNVTFDTYRGDGADAAIELNAAKRINISNLVVRNFKTAILINGKNVEEIDERSEDINVDNVIAENIEGHGIVIGNVLGAGDDLIRGNFSNINVKNTTLAGMHLRGKHIQVINAVFDSCGYDGILDVDGGVDHKFTNITAINCQRTGMDITGVTDLAISNFTAKDNNQAASTYPALRLNGGVSGKINGVKATGAHDYGIRSSGTNTIEMGGCSSEGEVNQGFRFSAGTDLIISGQNVGTFFGGVNGHGNRIFYGTGLPTSSFTSKVGDIIYNTAPTAGGNIGWVCVTAGTPGTWKTFGDIEA